MVISVGNNRSLKLVISVVKKGQFLSGYLSG